MDFARRLWFKPVVHLLLLLLFGGLIVLAYWLTHLGLNQKYQADISNISRLAFQTFGYQRSADGKSVALLQHGKPVDVAAEQLSKAPFGLESLPSFRGILSEHAGRAAAVTAFYRREKTAVLAAFSPERFGSRLIPVRSVGSSAGDLESQITAEQYRQLERAELDEFSVLAAQLIAAGTPSSPTNQAGITFAGLGSAVVERAAEEARKLANRSPGGRSGDALSSEVKAQIQLHFNLWARRLADQITAGQANRVPLDLAKVTSLDDVLGNLSANLAADLHAVAMAETGSLWLMGKFRWLEIIFWVWLGIVAMSFLKLIPFLLGRGGDETWEPRETLVVFPKLIYAPLLVLAVLFTAGTFGIGQLELAELSRSSPSILGVAFILGMFPNTTWRIIKDLCTRIFRDDLREGGAKPATPQAVTVASAVTVKDGQVVYTVEDLKRNVGEHVTAILKAGSN